MPNRDTLETIRRDAHRLLAMAKESGNRELVILLAQVIDTVMSMLDQLDADEIDKPGPGERMQ